MNGEVLRTLRLRAGLTVKSFAEKAKLAEATIEGLEHGRRDRVNDATLIALARGLEIDVAELDRLLKSPPGPEAPAAAPQSESA